MSGIANFFRGAANHIRNEAASPEQREMRDGIKRGLEVIKLSVLVAAAVTVLFLAIFPKIFTFVLASIVCFIAYEGFQLSNNGLEMLNDATVEATARFNKESLINQLSKKTLTIRSLINITNPPLEEIVMFRS